MYRIVLCATSALLAFGMGAVPALADDTDTCKRWRGEDSVAACNRLIEQNPGNAVAYLGRGNAYLYKRDYDRAISDYGQAIQLDPKLANAYVGRGNAYAGKRDYDRAISDHDQAILLDPKSAVFYGNRGSAYNSKREYDRAISDFDEAIRLDPKYAFAYNGRGAVYSSKREYDRAISDYDEATRLDPKYAVAYNGRGNAYNGKREYDRAIADLDQAITLDPRYAVAYGNRGNSHRLKGEYDRAISDYDEAIRLDPKSGFVYTTRCLAYSDKGEYDRALADCGQAINLDPKNSSAYNNRCLAYNGKGEYDHALADCEQAIKLNSNSPNPYSHRGFAYGKKGDFDRAMPDLDKAIELNPKYGRGYFNRAAIYELRGEFARAIADYDQAMTLDSKRAEAREGRDRAQAALALLPKPVTPPPSPARGAERRVALVIGNSAYRSVAFLPNPRRDAGAVADALRQAGFQAVELAKDLDRDGMVKALRKFRDEADRADWALIYFAGHGIEIGRVNYLIPTDAQLTDDRDVKAEAVSYEEMLSTVDGARALQIIVLDACRVNPFKDRMRRTVASRSATDRGLAPPPESKPGTLIVYSAKDGEVAEDGVEGGVNSPFARAFVAQLKMPGREVRRLFDFVRDEVLEATKDRQQPFTYGSLPARRDFYFVAGKQD
jgi:tetratricopeptide (TPR) repeat protein